MHVLQSLAGNSALLPNRDDNMLARRVDAADTLSIPSIALLPVADHAQVFREYEQRSSLYSHTDVARALWGQLNITCSISIMKQNMLTAFDSERAQMQAARHEVLHHVSPSDASLMQRSSFDPLATSLVHSLLLASSRIHRVTFSLFGHALSLSCACSQQPPQLYTLPPYDTRHNPHHVQLAPLPSTAVAAAGAPGLARAHELMQWTCGQELAVQALQPQAPWGCSLAVCDASHILVQQQNHAPEASAAIRQWAQARDDALKELSHTELELRQTRGECASVTMRCGSAAIGCVTIHSDGAQPLTLHDVVLAQHAADFAAPLFSATAAAAANDMFAVASSLCGGSALQHVLDAASIADATAVIRDAVKSIFRDDSVTASVFSDTAAGTLHSCDRATPVDVAPDATGLLCFARELQRPLIVTDPLRDPRYNSAVDVPAAFVASPDSGRSISLLIVPCVGRSHASSASLSVLGFIHIARTHLSSITPCCFSAVELTCIAKLAASAACLMHIIPQLRLAPTRSSPGGRSSRASAADATSPKAASSLLKSDGKPQAPVSSALLNLLCDRRDLALHIFRAVEAPHCDARLRRIASFALAQTDAPSAALLQHSVCDASSPLRHTSHHHPLLHLSSHLRCRSPLHQESAQAGQQQDRMAFVRPPRRRGLRTAPQRPERVRRGRGASAQ